MAKIDELQDNTDLMKACRTKLIKYVDVWLTPLYLRSWHEIKSIYWYERNEDVPNCAADVTVDWRYMHATVNYYVPAMVNMKDDELEYTVVHELCQILVNQMRIDRRVCTDNEERVVSQMAMAFICVRDMQPKIVQDNS